MNSLFGSHHSGANFSDDRLYRYALWRIWDDTKPMIMFIGLNPSTADESEPDSTITRVINFATDWGYGGIYMMNLFALVSTDSSVLDTHPDPLGDNDGWIQRIATKCKDVVFAWGNFKIAVARGEEVKKMFPNAYCIKKNRNGSPKHPLYIAADAKPFKYQEDVKN